LSFPVYVVLVIAISIVLTHVTNAARGGLIAAVATHTAVNVTAGFAASVLGGVREADQAIAMAALAVVLVVVTRGRLGASHSPAPLPLPLHSTPLHSTPSEARHDHH
jgi:membrane protease YdiL (CAAX protease family)